MALKIRWAKPTGKQSWIALLSRVALIGFAVFAVIVLSVFTFFYVKYQSVVDERLKQPIFANTAKIYAAPREVRPGQKLSVRLIANELRQAGYTADGASQLSQLGTYAERAQSITVRPGPQSYHAQDTTIIRVGSGVVESINDERGQPLASYELEPLLITGLSDDPNRTKRRLITYDEIPLNLVHAVLAIEDRRFFEHSGVNYMSMAGWAWHDVIGDRKHRGGASTLTMQLAKLLIVADTGTIRYKLAQIAVAFQLEHRFSKKQIFEMYANQIPLGQRGSFSIDGFGEASEAFFGKSVHDVNLSEAATLAGIIQRPSFLNPFRHAERVIERRNLVLDSMVETGAITKEQAERAKSEPLHLSAASVDASEAPYFVDLVHEQLNQRLGERDFNREGLRIYTSLDPDLQREATNAVESTIHVVDELVDKRHRHHKPGETWTYPQVALVALNPHTGQVLALVGGRSYGNSQLNHAVAKRPTGSIFKPFVYAAAFNTSVEGTPLAGQGKLFSQLTMLNDERSTYGQGTPYEYSPRNDDDKYYGQVTARFALQKSLNNATISLGSMVGFDTIAALARESGVKAARGTPSVAIGSYDAPPLDMAGAYTVFANNGLHIDPWMLASVRNANGDIISDYAPTSKQILDPRVAYLTTNMLENTINHGTGAGTRTLGFLAPAAGKTGTDHDAWFAGYTSNLICIVWVGNDDYTDVKLHGADAAAPIWAAFMKKAVLLPQYSDTHEFSPPEGVQIVAIDKASNLLSDDTCPDADSIAFLDGTAPTETCDHPADKRNLLQKIFGVGKSGRGEVSELDHLWCLWLDEEAFSNPPRRFWLPHGSRQRTVRRRNRMRQTLAARGFRLGSPAPWKSITSIQAVETPRSCWDLTAPRCSSTRAKRTVRSGPWPRHDPARLAGQESGSRVIFAGNSIARNKTASIGCC
jgi:penicillin-binding protein 1B